MIHTIESYESSLYIVESCDSELYEIKICRDKVTHELTNIIFHAKEFDLPVIEYKAHYFFISFDNSRYFIDQIDTLVGHMTYVKELLSFLKDNYLQEDDVHIDSLE